jgi:hypothetical protein
MLVLSFLAPLMYRGPVHRATEIYDTHTTLAGLVNSIVWLLYSIAVLRKEKCLDLVIVNVVCYASSFAHILAAYKLSRSKMKVSLFGV